MVTPKSALRFRMDAISSGPSSPSMAKGPSHHSLPRAVRSHKNPVLLSYDNIQPWHQDNEFILTGYRPESNSTFLSFASWGYMHNETGNIFSHLIPAALALIAVASCYNFFHGKYPEATIGDDIALALFLMAVAICFGISASYHTLMNHSEHIHQLWLRTDFVGIIVLIEGFFLSGIYVGFYCEPILQKIYWTMIISLGCISTFIILNPRFQGRRWRTFRLSTFVCTGLSALAPIAHGIKIFGLEQMNKQSGLPYYLLEGLIVMIGAYIYNARIPEALFPGKFDIWGSSHQIFHVLVVVAAGIHLLGISSAYDYNYINKRCSI